MADDITIAPVGTPYPVVTDELAGGRHVQVMKTAFGPDGALTAVDVATPLPVLSSVALRTTGLGQGWINANVAGANSQLAGTPGQVIRLYRIWFVAYGDVIFTLQSGSTLLHPPIPLVGNGAFLLDLDGYPWFTTAAGEDLVMNLNVAVQVSGQFYYVKG